MAFKEGKLISSIKQVSEGENLSLDFADGIAETTVNKIEKESEKGFFILFTILFVKINAEIRSVWVLPWDITTEKSIDEVIATAVSCNQNELLVEVRYRADALFDTSKGAYLYPNPEPKSYILEDASFDPLAYILKKAHQKGLAGTGLDSGFNATPREQSYIQQNYIYNNHKDWITYNFNGSQMNIDRQSGYFIDPGIPEVQGISA